MSFAPTGTSLSGDLEMSQRDTAAVRLAGQAAPARRGGGAVAGVASGFGAVMSALGANVGMKAPGAERLSPEQMFDPPPSSDPGERRREAVQDDYRESVTDGADALRDGRTGIEARKAARAKSVDDRSGVEPSGADAALRTHSANATETLPSGGSARPAPGSDLRPTQGGGVASVPEETVQAAKQGKDHSGVQVVGSDRASAAAPLPTTAAPTSATAGSTAASAGAAPANTAAGELAKLLAGGQTGKADSMAAPLAAAPSGDARSAARGPSENARAKFHSPEQSAAAPSTARKAEEASNTPFARLVRLMRSQAGRSSSARVMLEPPELGRIHVRVRMLGDRVEVGVETETAAARELISGRVERLKSALEHQGVVVERLEVSTNAAGLFEQRQAVGGGSGFPAQSGQERFAGGWPSRSSADGARAGEEKPVWGSGVAEWSAAVDARLDIRV